MSEKYKVSPATPLDAFDLTDIRSDFPVLKMKVDGESLVYLDNAASSQMPQSVIDRIIRYQTTEHANIHRGVHTLSERATAAYEEARIKLQLFINAPDKSEVIFTSGTTDAINLVMHGYGRKFIKANDEIILTELEHHSNIVPWKMLAEETGAIIKVLPITDSGELCIDQFDDLFNSRTKLVGLSHVSNALGTINPVKQMIQIAHQHGVPVLVDGAQAAPHIPINVQDLNCDFYAFSGHKLCGPTGIGVLYAKSELLERMQPYKGGGDMIISVSFNKVVYNTIPYKFEAGTPPIAAAIGLGAAIDYLQAIGINTIARHEHALLQYATCQLCDLPGLQLIGTARNKAAVLSFTLKDIHPHDVGTLLNQKGIAVRTGHHCAQPVMDHFKVAATTRASFAFYNTMEDVNALVAGIRHVQKVFS